MALKDISTEDKVKIALDAIIGEVFGRSSADIAQKYPGVSTRAVTSLKNQALSAIRDSFSGVSQPPVSALMSDEELSAGLDRLIGTTRLMEEAEADGEESEPDLQISTIVSAIVKYNDRAAKEDKPCIYISKAIVQDVANHSLKELDEYFSGQKKAIEDHNAKHGLHRSTNRGLKGQDWQSWVEF
jgi:ribosomal protein S13